MYDNLPWNDKELELIQIALAIEPKLTGIRPLLEHRYEAIDRYKSHFKGSATSEILDGIDPSQLGDLDKYGFDLLTLRNIRHRHTNYAQFWDSKSKSALHNTVWLIGFLKVGKAIKLQFPELAHAITLETIRRVSVKDRALLRNTILTLADHTRVGIFTQPYAELRSNTANRYNKLRLPHEPTKLPMDASSQDEIMKARINEQIVTDFISRNCDRALRKLGISMLDDYHAFVVRERVGRKAFSALADSYPELADACQRRADTYSVRLNNLMDIIVGKGRSTIYAPAISSVLARTAKAYNLEHSNGILEGTEPRLYLKGSAQVNAEAVRHILSHFSRYEEFMDIAASLPAPMASTQTVKIRGIFLNKVQEHYPELTEAIQAELRRLAPKSQGGIIGEGLRARLSA